MEVNLKNTTFDNLEIGQIFCLFHENELAHFVKCSFEKSFKMEDDSVHRFQKNTGVYTISCG